MLPKSTREHIKNNTKDGSLMINKNRLSMLFGTKKWSITDMEMISGSEFGRLYNPGAEDCGGLPETSCIGGKGNHSNQDAYGTGG
jgi:hypothetical protein